MIARLGLRLRILLFFAALAIGSVAAVTAGLVLGYRHSGDAASAPGFVTAGVLAGFVILGLNAGVWYLFDEHVARAIERLASGLRARAHADVADAIDRTPGRYLGDLAPAAEAVTLTLAETRNALAEAVARETSRLATEKERLEALLADVGVGVLLCSGDHQLAFYNGPAVELLGAETVPGLDRRVFDYLREAPIVHAYARLIETDDPDATSELLCATVGGSRVFAGRMRILEQGHERPGYVLTLRDVTGDLATLAAREGLLAEIFDRVRRPAANLQAAVDVMAEDGTTAPPELTAVVLDEAQRLARAVTELGARYDEVRSDGWPLSFVRASDLVDSIRAATERAGLALPVTADPVLVRCNGFEISALAGHLARSLAKSGRGEGLALSLREEGAGAVLDLDWSGAPLTVGELEGWLAQPLDVGVADVTGRSVLAVHAAECWPETRGPGAAALRLPLREARRVHRRPRPLTRAVVYDFDLLAKARSAGVADTALEDLTYVVFDTETTGLMPQQGDEIVQIAALRIVNARRVEGEVFETLVNPQRPIPPASTEVHGITDAMVAEAPTIAEVGRSFHAFAAGSVLIAHNAPFDMQFLRRHEGAMGAVFDHPILDTVLLSAVVFGQGEAHSLDALAHRLGITIPEEARHTAIGDAVATADAFLRLLPMLKAKGLRSFGDVLAEVRKHGRLLKDLNG